MRREIRLRTGKDFAKTYAQGRSRSNRYLVLYYLREQTVDTSTKIGFSVSKKIGSAVERNKIKRRMRAIVAEKYSRLKPGYKLVFIVRRPAKSIDFEQLRQSAVMLLIKCKIIEET